MKAIAAALSILIAVLMLAQPVLAGETSNKLTIPDVQGDLKKQYFVAMALGLYGNTGNLGPSWPDNSPIGKAGYLDVREATIEKLDDGTFEVTMTMWCTDLLAELTLTPGTKRIAYVPVFDTDLDGYFDYHIAVAYEGSTPFHAGDFDFASSITGAKITMWFDEDRIGNPSSLGFAYIVVVWWAPPSINPWGGCWNVDIRDSWTEGPGYPIWSA